MNTIFLIGFLAGVIAGISPCVLPILPIVLVGWAAPVEGEVSPKASSRRRSVLVVTGLALSFGLITALGSVVLSTLGLPQNLLRNVGLVLLVLFGASLISDKVESILERPFRRFIGKAHTASGSAFVLGLSLGTVFVPCAGPVLATISVLGATHKTNFETVLLSLFFALGVSVPLLFIALLGDQLIERNRRVAKKSKQLRPFAGGVMILVAAAIFFNWTAPLQKWIPDYTASLQRHIEDSSKTQHELRSLHSGANSNGNLLQCEQAASTTEVTTLQECGEAPAFAGITDWLNTPSDKALTLFSLRGKVVLVDFYTYSCINCQRTLPHVEAWYARYRHSGFEVVGVQAPEFAFEHVLSNIKDAAHQLGIKYPIAVDNNLATWTAYDNEYWPAEYLIDASGVIRHVTYGEGNYSADESLIRKLLLEAHPKEQLPPPTNVPDNTPVDALSPETYLGSDRSEYYVGAPQPSNGTQTYFMPKTVSGGYALSGTWQTTNQYIEAVGHAKLDLAFEANDVYLVLGGTGTIRVTLNGKFVKNISVSGFPTLYTMVQQSQDRSGLLELSFSSGVQAYDFTFG
jgi:cytochrome c biogenesis protein CcdA/thiol-disulfide isomerase/thioredoxin